MNGKIIYIFVLVLAICVALSFGQEGFASGDGPISEPETDSEAETKAGENGGTRNTELSFTALSTFMCVYLLR